MTYRGSLCLATILFIGLALPARAEWTLRAAAEGLFPSGETEIDDDPGSILLEPEPSLGVTLELERRLSDRWGLAGGGGLTTLGVEVRFRPPVPGIENPLTDDDRVSRAWLGPRFYLLRGERARIAIGPSAEYFSSADLDFPDIATSATVESELTWGFHVNLDFEKARSPWSFHSSVGYIDSSMAIDQEGAPDIDHQPVVVRVGVGRRFGGGR